MITSNQITPGMTISHEGGVYRVESSVKVTVAKGVPFMKTKLKNVMSDELVEKNFKLDQEIESVSLVERRLEFLYPEGDGFLFLDIDELNEVLADKSVVGDKVDFLKEGIQIKAFLYGDTVFSIELPQFLEVMILKVEAQQHSVASSSNNKLGVLETGAKVEVPLFIEAGDVIKVDTSRKEFVQRI